MGELWKGLVVFLDDPPVESTTSDRAPDAKRRQLRSSTRWLKAPSEPELTPALTSTTRRLRPYVARPSRCHTNSPSGRRETSGNPRYSAERGSAKVTLDRSRVLNKQLRPSRSR
jgi:hypothetical protein